MTERARVMRGIKPKESSREIERACSAISDARDSAREGKPGWEETIREVTFWGEAAVWAAASGDSKTFDLCLSKVTSAVSERMSVH